MTHILITNDDGVQSPGLLALAQALRAVGDVSVFAPHRNWSISGHNKTMHKSLRVWQAPMADGTAATTTDGSPTDCVSLATSGLVERPIDLLFSGINTRANLGDDLTYSGTVAAALEGTLNGIPSIAISIDNITADNSHWQTAAAVAVQMARHVLAYPLPADTLLNINVPNVPAAQLRGYRATWLGRRIYNDYVVTRTDPVGKPYYWIAGDEPVGRKEPGSDSEALAQGYVSVSPVQLDMTSYTYLDTLRQVLTVDTSQQ